MKLQNEQVEHANTVEVKQNLVQIAKMFDILIYDAIITCAVRKNCFHNQIFGNKFKVSIIDKGNAKICSKDGTNVTIADVFFVLDLVQNFLSIRQLTEKYH